MTLDTRMYVRDEVSALELFHEARRLLGCTDASPYTVENSDIWESWVASNEPGQGLPAWLMVFYRDGRPLRTPDDERTCDDDCEEGCDGSWHLPACWAEVSMDTAYSYRDEQGRNCGQLHAFLVAQLGMWCDDRGLAWGWRNEYSGEKHFGDERYARLVDLAGQSHEARYWLQHTVLPLFAPTPSIGTEEQG